MARDLQARLRRLARGVILGSLLSLAGGYVLFFGVFPTVAFPASGEAPLPTVLLILAAVALVAGFACEDLGMGIAISVLSLFGSIAIGVAMALSPLLEGLYLLDPGEVLGFLVHYGFVFLVLMFAVNLVCVIIGYGIHERYLVQRPRTFAEAVGQHRK